MDDHHDSAGQIITVLGMNSSEFEAQLKGCGAEVSATLAENRALIGQLSQELRTTSYLPPLLDEMGLPAAVRAYTKGLAERSGLKVEVEITEGFDRLETDK